MQIIFVLVGTMVFSYLLSLIKDTFMKTTAQEDEFKSREIVLKELTVKYKLSADLVK